MDRVEHEAGIPPIRVRRTLAIPRAAVKVNNTSDIAPVPRVINQNGLGVETARTIGADSVQEPPETTGAGLGVGVAAVGGWEGALNGVPSFLLPERCAGTARVTVGTAGRTAGPVRAWSVFRVTAGATDRIGGAVRGRNA